MRWGLLVAMCLVGCGGDEGVALEIDADVDLDHVELFVVNHTCWDEALQDSCKQGVVWPGQTTRSPGYVYESSFDQPKLELMQKQDGKIVVNLEAASDYSDVSIAIAGYKDGAIVAAGVLPYVAIPRHTSEVWKVKLEPAVDTESGATDARIRAHAWERVGMPEYSGCFVLQESDGNGGWRSEYYVPANDHDCDGTPDCDMDDFWYDKPLQSSISACLTDEGPLVPGTCTLGAGVCVTGEGTTSCRQAAVIACVPDQLCDDCSADPALGACALTSISQTSPGDSSLAHAKCVFTPSQEGLPCGNVFSGAMLRVPLPGVCGVPLLHHLGSPFEQGAQKIDIGGESFLEVHATELGGGGCGYDLTWTTQAAITSPTSQFVVLEVAYTTATGTRRQFLPVYAEFSSPVLCDTTRDVPSECAVLAQSDGVYLCPK